MSLCICTSHLHTHTHIRTLCVSLLLHRGQTCCSARHDINETKMNDPPPSSPPTRSTFEKYLLPSWPASLLFNTRGHVCEPCCRGLSMRAYVRACRRACVHLCVCVCVVVCVRVCVRACVRARGVACSKPPCSIPGTPTKPPRA